MKSRIRLDMSYNVKNEITRFAIGLEHEVMLFHHHFDNKPVKHMKFVEIQTILNEYLKHNKENPYLYNLLNRIAKIQLEESGRLCGGKWVLKKIAPNSLIEFVTRVAFTYISSDVNESTLVHNFEHMILQLFTDQYYLRSLMQEIRVNAWIKRESRYGLIAPIPFGMFPNILATENKGKFPYTFRKEMSEDYTGSYHVTITLPFVMSEKYTMKEEREFIDMHKNLAKMLQWLEPLFVATYCTGDLRAVGPIPVDDKGVEHPRVRGSFRIFRCGWGTLGGTNLPTLQKGCSRYATQDIKWRDGLKDMDGYDAIEPCMGLKKTEGGVSAFGTDFRTFGPDPKNPKERLSGAPMSIPNGFEWRIMDHFDTLALFSFTQAIALIIGASHHQTFKISNPAYNPVWIQTVQNIMRDGWKAELPQEYMDIIDHQILGIKRKHMEQRKSKRFVHAQQYWHQIIDELFKQYKGDDWFQWFSGESMVDDVLPMPNLNRDAWEAGFLLYLANNVNWRKELYAWLESLQGKVFTQLKWKEEWIKFIGDSNWGTQWWDIACFCESFRIAELKGGYLDWTHIKIHQDISETLELLVNFHAYIHLMEGLDRVKTIHQIVQFEEYIKKINTRTNEWYMQTFEQFKGQTKYRFNLIESDITRSTNYSFYHKNTTQMNHQSENNNQ